MALHLVDRLQMVNIIFLQLTFVAEAPVSFEVLQPARTFSSGVPLPRTINWGGIHFFRFSSMLSFVGGLFYSSSVFQRETYDVVEMALH
jgi:hypothetical protein